MEKTAAKLVRRFKRTNKGIECTILAESLGYRIPLAQSTKTNARDAEEDARKDLAMMIERMVEEEPEGWKGLSEIEKHGAKKGQV